MVTWTSSSSREVFTVPGACGQAQHPLVARQNLGDEPADAAAHGMLLPPRLQDGSEARPLPLRCDLKAASAGFVVGFRKQQALPTTSSLSRGPVVANHIAAAAVIANRPCRAVLCDLPGCDPVAADSQHPVIAACGEVYPLDRPHLELAAGGIARGDLVQKLAVGPLPLLPVGSRRASLDLADLNASRSWFTSKRMR
jgi:hypothetical protein